MEHGVGMIESYDLAQYLASGGKLALLLGVGEPYFES